MTAISSDGFTSMALDEMRPLQRGALKARDAFDSRGHFSPSVLELEGSGPGAFEKFESVVDP